jgi:hypothetical protein
MTVRELIRALRSCNPAAEVMTCYMPEDDGDLIICKVTGVTDRGELNRTEDKISLDIVD